MTPLSQAIITPLAGAELNFRIDRQLTSNHTLTALCGHNRDSNDNQGVGVSTVSSVRPGSTPWLGHVPEGWID